MSLKKPLSARQSSAASTTGMTVVSRVLYSAYADILGASMVTAMESIATSTGLAELSATAA